MPQTPYLVRIGQRGFNLLQVVTWEYQSACGETRSSLTVYYTNHVSGRDYIGQGYDTFYGPEAEGLMAYLEDMSVDVLASAGVAVES